MISPLIKPLTQPLPPRAIFAPTPFLLDAVLQALPVKQHLTRIYGSSIYLSSSRLVVGPFLGSPAAVMLAETLIASGISQIILFSVAGALSENGKAASPGDIIYPRGALSEEGTSRLYDATAEITFNANPLQQELESNICNPQFNARNHYGSIWTTDAPFRETSEKLSYYLNRGAIAVDMEFSALAHLCYLRGVSLGAVFLVSDTLTVDSNNPSSWPEWSPAFQNPVLKLRIKQIADRLVAWKP